MPVEVKKRGDVYRVVESGSGQIAKNAAGTAADGGGHASPATAQRQANAINASKDEKR